MLPRRAFLASAALPLTAAKAEYRVGITTNTRGGWESDVFLSFREARDAGYRHVESFIHYFTAYLDKPEELLAKTRALGVSFVTVSNGSPLEMRFHDPAHHSRILEDHTRLGRFIRKLGCSHLKINMGPRRPGGTTGQDLGHMATVLNTLGRRLTDEGIKLGVHAHMWSQLENQREVDQILEATDARHVWFVLDTGHVTMAGMDPVGLTRRLGHRIIEFHLKDVAPEHRGGASTRPERNDPMKDPIFFALGTGGVDFPAIKAQLDGINWKGWLTVELDSSPSRPPVESARMSRKYLETKLGLRV